MKHLFNLAVLILAISGPSFSEAGLLLTRVSLDQATQQIIKSSNFRVLGAYTEIVDGREIHVIKVLTPDGHIRHYRIDAETGKPVN